MGGVTATLDDPEVDECDPTLLGEHALLKGGIIRRPPINSLNHYSSFLGILPRIFNFLNKQYKKWQIFLK